MRNTATATITISPISATAPGVPCIEPLAHQTPWEEMSREITGQLDSGACIERATRYIKIIEQRGEARHAH